MGSAIQVVPGRGLLQQRRIVHFLESEEVEPFVILKHLLDVSRDIKAMQRPAQFVDGSHPWELDGDIAQYRQKLAVLFARDPREKRLQMGSAQQLLRDCNYFLGRFGYVLKLAELLHLVRQIDARLSIRFGSLP